LDRLGRRSFFDEAVEVVMGRIKARVEQKNLAATANGESTACAFAPRGDWIRELIRRETGRLKREIESRFVRTGKLGLGRSVSQPEAWPQNRFLPK
jgi:hypothetical protein